MIGILGPNGAGKTTLLRMLAGVLDSSLGTIRYGGVRLNEIKSRIANWVGYLPQEFGLPDHLTAREYLAYYALLYDIGAAKEREERISKLLADVGLAERSGDRIGGFSGGMRQRVAVARALLREPPVIIVDEPTVGLDPRERIRFRNLLASLAQTRVVLFSTHVVEDVAVACDRVIVLSRGRVAYDGRPGELAQVAQGNVWEVVLDAREADLKGAKVIDRVPQADGRIRLRALSRASPHPQAMHAEPTLEDGYLQLVGEDR
jgi:ABC-type multidrug transport system ATPase subunit